MIEAIELAILGFVLWCASALLIMGDPEVTFLSIVLMLFIFEGVLLGSWLIYNLYIRIARAGGKTVDVAIWVIAAAATASYTFWAWTILDINRWLMKKLVYRGDAPVEYAWSARSKEIRKIWEQSRQGQHQATARA
jgi:hypothetical protein